MNPLQQTSAFVERLLQLECPRIANTSSAKNMLDLQPGVSIIQHIISIYIYIYVCIIYIYTCMCIYIYRYGCFQSMGGTPKSSKLDHDLVLEPMVTWVTWGSPPQTHSGSVHGLGSPNKEGWVGVYFGRWWAYCVVSGDGRLYTDWDKRTGLNIQRRLILSGVAHLLRVSPVK